MTETENISGKLKSLLEDYHFNAEAQAMNAKAKRSERESYGRRGKISGQAAAT